MGSKPPPSSSTRQPWLVTAFRTHPVALPAILSFLIQLVMIAYGEYQDRHMAVKYTDVDYRVFSDAVRFIWEGGRDGTPGTRAQGWLPWVMGWKIGDPYNRSTFRYTPLLPLLLSPIHLLPQPYGPLFGKLIFSFTSSFIIHPLLLSPPISSPLLPTIALWTFNPIILNINTRGSSESLLVAQVLVTLVLLKKGKMGWAGAAWAMAVGWKIYPIVYAASIWTMLWRRAGGGLRSLVTKEMVRFGLASAGTFGLVTLCCWSIWGYPFIYHTYLYHIHRLDHRHNFSPYFYPIYLSMPFIADHTSSLPPTSDPSFLSVLTQKLGTVAHHPLASFVPQASVTLLAGFLLPMRTGIEFAWFAQTWLFVMFNKVCTSQYFLWFIFLLPPILPRLHMTTKKACVLVGMWIGGQALWLSLAFRLEFLSEAVYLPLWAAGIVFMLVNAYILGEMFRAYD